MQVKMARHTLCVKIVKTLKAHFSVGEVATPPFEFVAAEEEEVDTKASDGSHNLYVGLFTAIDGCQRLFGYGLDGIHP